MAFGPFFIILGYMKENSLFVEKYRSKTLDEYVGNEQLKQIVEKYIKKFKWISLTNNTSDAIHLPGSKVIQAYEHKNTR